MAHQHLHMDTETKFVVVNLCHLDQATGCPDMWPNIPLGVSVMVFLDGINT